MRARGLARIELIRTIVPGFRQSASKDARERAIAFLWDRIVARKLAADCEQQTRQFVAAAQARS